MLTNKYEKLCEDWRLKILKIDFKERYESLNLSGYNEKNLPITYYGIKYIIDRLNCNIYYEAFPEKYVDPYIRFAIYHLFYFSKPKPKNSNNFVPLYEIKPAAPFYDAFKRTVLDPFAKTFEGKSHLLEETYKKLGFESIPFSDVGFVTMAFSCMPIQFLFWDGDDEFSARSNILFDKNITDFTHEETVITIASDGVKLLAETAGLSLPSLFSQ